MTYRKFLKPPRNKRKKVMEEKKSGKSVFSSAAKFSSVWTAKVKVSCAVTIVHVEPLRAMVV